MRGLLLRIIPFLYELALPKTMVDKVNSKLLEPVPGLVIDGRQYFRYANPDDIPAFRYVHFLNYREEVSMGASRQLICSFVEDLRKANNRNNPSQVGALLAMLEKTVKDLTPMEAYYWMAALECFDPSVENTTEFDYDLNKRKVEAFKKLKTPGFFLQTLSRHMTEVGRDLPADKDLYLKEVQVQAKAFEALRMQWRKASE